MKQVAEKYLAGVGPRFGTVLLATLLLWIAIGLGAVLYALATGLFGVYSLTRAALGGGWLEIGLSVLVWTFLLLSVVLARSAAKVWRRQRIQRWAAEKALTEIEGRLFPGEPRAVYLDDPRERLALRMMESMEKRLLGASRSVELSLEERLIELAQRAPAG